MKSYLLAATAALAFGGAANAATLSIENGTAGVIPAPGQTNEVLEVRMGGASLAGFFDSQIVAAGFSEGDSILVEVIGYEAGFQNTFTLGSNSFTSMSGMQVAETGSLASFTYAPVADGLLPFIFSTNGDVEDPVVANGDENVNQTGFANFFASAMEDGSIWLFFDDGGGRDTDGDGIDDDNHDDLVVRISAVPLPAGGLLLLSGLGALAVSRRRKASA